MVIGYSSDSAMTDFVDGTSSIVENGSAMFEEGTEDATCIINEELATYNDLSVGDTITLVNPNNEADTVMLTICGIYQKESSVPQRVVAWAAFSEKGFLRFFLFAFFDDLC